MKATSALQRGRWLAPFQIRRDVDADGRVLCPIGLRLVPLTNCRTCASHVGSVGADGEATTPVECRPSYRAVIRGALSRGEDGFRQA